MGRVFISVSDRGLPKSISTRRFLLLPPSAAASPLPRKEEIILMERGWWSYGVAVSREKLRAYSTPIRRDPVEAGARSQFAGFLTLGCLLLAGLILQHLNLSVNLLVTRHSSRLLARAAQPVALFNEENKQFPENFKNWYWLFKTFFSIDIIQDASKNVTLTSQKCILSKVCY